MLKRILRDTLFIAVGLGIAWLTIQPTTIPEKYYLPTSIILSLIGLGIGEKRFLLRWIMNILRATQILINQERNLVDFVKPYVSYANLFPNQNKQTDEVDYIDVVLSWDNRTLRKVKIHNIKGTLSIDGSKPPDDLPTVIPDVNLGELKQSLDSKCIHITITRDALRTIQGIRQTGYGQVNLVLEIVAMIDGISVSYDIVYNAHFIS